MTEPMLEGTPSELEALEGFQAGPAASLWSDAWRQLRRRPIFLISAFLVLLMILIALFPGLFNFPGYDPRDCPLEVNGVPNARLRPSAEHWFGTDLLGCDYYARVIYGTRVSIAIGVTVTVFATAIALVFGSIAGYFGGIIDTLIARVTDIVFAIPVILGGILILSIWRRGFFLVCVVLIVLGWPTMLRLARSSVLAVKENDYVDAARALGASRFRIIRRHILPNALAPVIVYATITIGVIISAEAALSFLGVGLQLPAISWGLMISQAQHRLRTDPHLLFFPGLFLSITVFAFILLGDALRDALDPRLR
jgi:oligopeptide transport system permease protein